MPSTSSSTHRETIERELGVDIADAIDGRIDEKIKFAFDHHKEELRGIIDEQVRISNEAQALPPEQREQVAPVVNDANQEIREATDEFNTLLDRHHRGEHVEQAEMDRVQQRMMAAHQRQAEAMREVAQAQRETPARPQVTRPGVTRVSTQSAHSGSTVTPAPVPNVSQRLDAVERRLNEQEPIIASSYGMSRTALLSGNAGQQAARIGLATFVVVFLVYCLVVVMFNDVTWDWSNALGIPAIFAGIAAAVIYTRSSGRNQVEYMTYNQVKQDNDQREAHRSSQLRHHEQAEHRQEHHHDGEHRSSGRGLDSLLRRS